MSIHMVAIYSYCRYSWCYGIQPQNSLQQNLALIHLTISEKPCFTDADGRRQRIHGPWHYLCWHSQAELKEKKMEKTIKNRERIIGSLSIETHFHMPSTTGQSSSEINVGLFQRLSLCVVFQVGFAHRSSHQPNPFQSLLWITDSEGGWNRIGGNQYRRPYHPSYRLSYLPWYWN